MGTPLFIANTLFAPLQQFARWLARSIAGVPGRQQRAPTPPAARPVGARAVPAGPVRPLPLRVVRVLEGSQAAASAGRMVISGRMADVCAELERLAALEAAAG